jgi:hypothetical protein
MNGQGLSLKPFPSVGLLPKIKITANIERRINTLFISYVVLGPLIELIIPVPAEKRKRKSALWEETCFEFFFCVKNSDHYWEFNLSPAGHWNIYRFLSYREGMCEEPLFTSLPFSVERHSDSLRLSMQLDLNKLIPADQTIKIAAGTVIKTIDGTITYWALAHTGPQADFHRRDSFIVEL